MNGELSPYKFYTQQLNTGAIMHDPAQAACMQALNSIYTQLLATPAKWWQRRWTPVQGLYIWGGVGRGKTWLMDMFFERLPLTAKRRVHFHDFMQAVHAALNRYKNKRDPLQLIAKEWAQDRVLCFDEFFVTDIADAMILSRLMQALFEQNITLIATSNRHPDELYANGLQRQRFLPAIERLKQYCQILELDNGQDYRQMSFKPTATYYWPANVQAEQTLLQQFNALTAGTTVHNQPLTINHRPLAVIKRNSNTAWFSFDALCTGPRAASDYSALAAEFETILISDIPQFNTFDDEAARRFINLIDILYDQNIALYCSAASQPNQLYQGKELAFAFKRTASRLREMTGITGAQDTTEPMPAVP